MLVETKIMLVLTQTFGQNIKCIRYKGPHNTKAPKPQHLSAKYVISPINILIMTGRHLWTNTYCHRRVDVYQGMRVLTNK